MTNPKDTLWEIEPHTQAKHEILERYLGAWFGIMGRNNPRILFVDGFCGPGKYSGGETGSPLLALRIAKAHNEKQNIQEAFFIFIDQRKDRIEFLKSEISTMGVPKNFHVFTEVNEFEGTLINLLDDMDKSGKTLPPAFVFIDPFGFKGSPFSLVKRLLSNQKTEIFINIMADSINRFIEVPDEQIPQHIIDLFGTSKVLEIINNGGDRVKEIRDLYQEQLLRCAKFVRFFEMRDANNRIIYCLFFASNNRLGHVKMKEALWSVDKQTGLSFSDATNPNQMVLFNLDPSQEISKIIFKRFNMQVVEMQKIIDFIEDETAFITTQLRETLRRLEIGGQICVEPCKRDGKHRNKASFPPGAIIRFE